MFHASVFHIEISIPELSAHAAARAGFAQRAAYHIPL
jgi:hypothetical protein